MKSRSNACFVLGLIAACPARYCTTPPAFFALPVLDLLFPLTLWPHIPLTIADSHELNACMLAPSSTRVRKLLSHIPPLRSAGTTLGFSWADMEDITTPSSFTHILAVRAQSPLWTTALEQRLAEWIPLSEGCAPRRRPTQMAASRRGRLLEYGC
jgi:hypothetical protein